MILTSMWRDYYPPGELTRRAEHAIALLDGYKKQWFLRLLDILRTRNAAKIWDEGSDRPLGVSAIGYTHVYLSFFDVYNHIHFMKIDYSRFPEPTILDGILK